MLPSWLSSSFVGVLGPPVIHQLAWNIGSQQSLLCTPLAQCFFRLGTKADSAFKLSSGILNQQVGMRLGTKRDKPTCLIGCLSQNVLRRRVASNDFLVVEGGDGFC